MPSSLLTFINNHSHILATKLLEHIYLVFVAITISIAIGVPLGIWITYRPKIKNAVLGITNIFQTIPSLALLAFLIPFLGIGVKPTIVTLTIYALLPITRNTFIGLDQVPSESIEAANGLGFTSWQRLRMIELPLALPVIISGIRIATAMTIGITTIAAFIGAGGLGDFITEGLALANSRLILLGAIPAALLALGFDFIIGSIEKLLSSRKQIFFNYKKVALVTTVFAAIVLISSPFFFTARSHKNNIVIATKNFSEQFILGDLMAEMISAKTHLNVIKKFNLGNTIILQNALLNNEIDLYPEYTGTAYTVILKQNTLSSPKEIYQTVKKSYLKKYNLVWLNPFGFNNSQALAVSKTFATKNHLTNLSELAQLSKHLTIAAPAEFLKRPDALPGLTTTYGFKFKKIFQVQPDLVYQSINNHAANVIEVFTTDGRIQAYNLIVLKDDKRFYKAYDAAPVIRKSMLAAHPEIAQTLRPLLGVIDEKTMQHLNYLVDVKHQSPEKVAHEFLAKKHLL